MSNNSLSATQQRFGAFACDSPYSLLISALEAIPQLVGEIDGIVFTGKWIDLDRAAQAVTDSRWSIYRRYCFTRCWRKCTPN